MDAQPNPEAGFVRGKHYTEYVELVKKLKRSGDEVGAERLLLELVDATVSEARSMGWGVAPWYYEQLVILYRTRRDIAQEVAILERFEKQDRSRGRASQASSTIDECPRAPKR